MYIYMKIIIDWKTPAEAAFSFSISCIVIFFWTFQDLSARLDSTSKEDASGAPSSDESANNEKQKNNGANTVTYLTNFDGFD